MKPYLVSAGIPATEVEKVYPPWIASDPEEGGGSVVFVDRVKSIAYKKAQSWSKDAVRREAFALKTLKAKDPGLGQNGLIPDLLAVGEEGPLPYVAWHFPQNASPMEVITEEGGSRVWKMSGLWNSLTSVQQLDVVLDVAEAIRRLHLAGVVHNDVWAPNILIWFDDQKKAHGTLIDFGHSLYLGDDADVKAAYKKVPTPSLMRYFFKPGVEGKYQADIQAFGGVLRNLEYAEGGSLDSLIKRMQEGIVANMPTIEEVIQELRASGAVAVSRGARLSVLHRDNPYGDETFVTRGIEEMDNWYSLSLELEEAKATPKKMLLIGAGRGVTAVQLAIRYPKLRILAVNKEGSLWNPQKLEKVLMGRGYTSEAIREALPRVDMQVMDVESESDRARVLKDSRFDFVVMEPYVMMYITKKSEVIEKLFNDRVAPNGIFAFQLTRAYLAGFNEENDEATRKLADVIKNSFRFSGTLLVEKTQGLYPAELSFKYRRRELKEIVLPLKLKESELIPASQTPPVARAVYELSPNSGARLAVVTESPGHKVTESQEGADARGQTAEVGVQKKTEGARLAEQDESPGHQVTRSPGNTGVRGLDVWQLNEQIKKIAAEIKEINGIRVNVEAVLTGSAIYLADEDGYVDSNLLKDLDIGVSFEVINKSQYLPAEDVTTVLKKVLDERTLPLEVDFRTRGEDIRYAPLRILYEDLVIPTESLDYRKSVKRYLAFEFYYGLLEPIRRSDQDEIFYQQIRSRLLRQENEQEIWDTIKMHQRFASVLRFIKDEYESHMDRQSGIQKAYQFYSRYEQQLLEPFRKFESSRRQEGARLAETEKQRIASTIKALKDQVMHEHAYIRETTKVTDSQRIALKQIQKNGFRYLDHGAHMIAFESDQYPGLVFKMTLSDRLAMFYRLSLKLEILKRYNLKAADKIINGWTLSYVPGIVPTSFYDGVIVQEKGAEILLPENSRALLQFVTTLIRSGINYYDQSPDNEALIDGRKAIVDLGAFAIDEVALNAVLAKLPVMDKLPISGDDAVRALNDLGYPEVEQRDWVNHPYATEAAYHQLSKAGKNLPDDIFLAALQVRRFQKTLNANSGTGARLAAESESQSHKDTRSQFEYPGNAFSLADFYGARLSAVQLTPVSIAEGVIFPMMSLAPMGIEYVSSAKRAQMKRLAKSISEPDQIEQAEFERVMSVIGRAAGEMRALPADDYDVHKPVRFLVVVDGEVSKNRVNQIQDLTQQFAGGVISIYVGSSVQALAAIPVAPGEAVVVVGKNSQALLQEGARLSAGVIVMPDDFSADYFHTLIDKFVFAVGVQRTQKLKDARYQLTQLWNNFCANPTIELTEDVYQLSKTAPPDARVEQYKDLVFRMTKVKWQAALEAASKALRFVTTAA